MQILCITLTFHCYYFQLLTLLLSIFCNLQKYISKITIWAIYFSLFNKLK